VGVDRIRIRGEVMGGKEVMNREILCSEKEGRGTKATRKSSHTMRKS